LRKETALFTKFFFELFFFRQRFLKDEIPGEHDNYQQAFWPRSAGKGAGVKRVRLDDDID